MKPEYLTGLFDAEGSVNVHFARFEKKINVRPQLMINLGDAYFAGLFDGDGSIFIRFMKRKGKRRRKLISNPALSIRIKNNKDLLEAIKEKYGGSISHSKDFLAWTVCSIDDVERITDILLSNSIIKTRQLLIMKHIILPVFKKKEHLTKEGLLKLAKIHKELNPQRKKPLTVDWEELIRKRY